MSPLEAAADAQRAYRIRTRKTVLVDTRVLAAVVASPAGRTTLLDHLGPRTAAALRARHQPLESEYDRLTREGVNPTTAAVLAAHIERKTA